MYSLQQSRSSSWFLAILVSIALLAPSFATPASAAHFNSADTDQDNFINVLEGVPFYGAIEVSLTTTGDTSPASGLALDRFPIANADGNYYYDRTFVISDEVRDSLSNGSFVIHGIDIDNSGEYDGEKESEIAPGVPFEATVPAACGTVEPNGHNKYTVQLNQLNSTGVNGEATLKVKGNKLTVYLEVNDSSPNLPHAQHIHIGGTGECPPNTAGVSAPQYNTSGELSGTVDSPDGVLKVTSIEMIKTSATADGMFVNGWKYVFYITAPMNEQNIAMKFNDWFRIGGGGTIAVANNIRISSPQANNGGATILLTGANTYSSPNLIMTEDLDPSVDGRQVQVIVEVAVPVGTQNGSYTTSYGVQSNP